MTSQDAPGPTPLQADLRTLTRIAGRIERATSEQERLERIAEFLRLFEDLRERIYDLRDKTAANIYKAEELSLAKLAERVGISKARADQIINPERYKRKPAATEEEPT